MAAGLSLPPAYCVAIRCGLPCANSSIARGTWGATWVAEVIQLTSVPPSSTTFTGLSLPGSVTVVVTGFASRLRTSLSKVADRFG
ncbi:hypothetical protein [Streptomyces sp. CS62]|uniref:hypothetical protein n=1 Tax=Streptomyces sp. CS62 TaxID=3119268 RepID=UPI002F957266